MTVSFHIHSDRRARVIIVSAVSYFVFDSLSGVRQPFIVSLSSFSSHTVHHSQSQYHSAPYKVCILERSLSLLLRCYTVQFGWNVLLYTIRWGKFSQKHNYEYVAKWWCLLALENYMFRPMAAIMFWQFSCYKSCQNLMMATIGRNM